MSLFRVGIGPREYNQPFSGSGWWQRPAAVMLKVCGNDTRYNTPRRDFPPFALEQIQKGIRHILKRTGNGALLLTPIRVYIDTLYSEDTWLVTLCFPLGGVDDQTKSGLEEFGEVGGEGLGWREGNAWGGLFSF